MWRVNAIAAAAPGHVVVDLLGASAVPAARSRCRAGRVPGNPRRPEPSSRRCSDPSDEQAAISLADGTLTPFLEAAGPRPGGPHAGVVAAAGRGRSAGTATSDRAPALPGGRAGGPGGAVDGRRAPRCATSAPPSRRWASRRSSCSTELALAADGPVAPWRRHPGRRPDRLLVGLVPRRSRRLRAHAPWRRSRRRPRPRTVDDELVVLDRSTGSVHRLNRSAEALVWLVRGPARAGGGGGAARRGADWRGASGRPHRYGRPPLRPRPPPAVPADWVVDPPRSRSLVGAPSVDAPRTFLRSLPASRRSCCVPGAARRRRGRAPAALAETGAPGRRGSVLAGLWAVQQTHAPPVAVLVGILGVGLAADKCDRWHRIPVVRPGAALARRSAGSSVSGWRGLCAVGAAGRRRRSHGRRHAGEPRRLAACCCARSVPLACRWRASTPPSPTRRRRWHWSVLCPARLGWPMMAVALAGCSGAAVLGRGWVTWVAAVDGRGRPPSIIGAVLCAGLLAALPVVAALAGRRRRRWAPSPPIGAAAVVAFHGAVSRRVVAGRGAGDRGGAGPCGLRPCWRWESSWWPPCSRHRRRPTSSPRRRGPGARRDTPAGLISPGRERHGRSEDHYEASAARAAGDGRPHRMWGRLE